MCTPPLRACVHQRAFNHARPPASRADRDASRLEDLGADPASLQPPRDLKAAAAVAAALASRAGPRRAARPSSDAAAGANTGEGGAGARVPQPQEQRQPRWSVASTSGGAEGAASRQQAEAAGAAFDGIFRVSAPREKLLSVLDAEAFGFWAALGGGGYCGGQGGGDGEGLRRVWSGIAQQQGFGGAGRGPGRPAWVACSVHSGNELERAASKKPPRVLLPTQRLVCRPRPEPSSF